MSYRSRASIRLLGSDNSVAPTARRGSAGGSVWSGKIQPMAIRSRRSIWLGRLRILAITIGAVLLLTEAWHGWALLAH